jgi:hypothetical protein
MRVNRRQRVTKTCGLRDGTGQSIAGIAAIREGEKMARTLFSATILAGALAGAAMAQAQMPAVSSICTDSGIGSG